MDETLTALRLSLPWRARSARPRSTNATEHDQHLS